MARRANVAKKKAGYFKIVLSFIKRNTVLSLIFCSAFAVILKNTVRNKLLETTEARTVALVIEHKNPLGNNNVARKFTYSYRFTINDKHYYGNTQSTEYQVGDVVEVKYVPSYPSFNEIVESK